MTFDTTDNPICYEGGDLVFIDAERDTWNMEPVALEKTFELYSEFGPLSSPISMLLLTRVMSSRK